jgi:hypothetical protein
MQRDSSVRTTLNYTADDGTVPEVYFYEPPPGTVVKAPGDDPHEMEIADGWSRANNFSLDCEGFALKEFHSTFDRFDDDQAVRNEFYETVAEFVRSSVGARRVIVFDHTIRSKVNVQQQTAEHSTSQRASGYGCALRLYAEFWPFARASADTWRGGCGTKAARGLLQPLEAAEATRRGKATGDV